jgi:hypothetical protein
MSIRSRLEKLERNAPDDFCPTCMVIRFVMSGDPERPKRCPDCKRGPGDYPAGMVRDFVIHKVERQPENRPAVDPLPPSSLEGIEGGNGVPPFSG